MQVARRGDAVADGVVLSNCTSTTIDRMAVLTAGGAAFIEQDGCSNNTFLGCVMLRSLPFASDCTLPARHLMFDALVVFGMHGNIQSTGRLLHSGEPSSLLFCLVSLPCLVAALQQPLYCNARQLVKPGMCQTWWRCAVTGYQ